jgi:hypothetical protein
VTQLYTFAERAHFISKLLIERNSCYDLKSTMTFWQNFVNRLMWIHLFVMALAIISFIVSWRYIYDIAQKYGKIHEEKRRVIIN